MKVKICGITSAADAQAAAEAGADWIGLNFVGGPRRIDAAQAEAILAAAPTSITPVALVTIRDETLPPDQTELLRRLRVSIVQLYGDVTPRTISQLRAEGWQAWIVQAAHPDTFPRQVQTFLDQCEPDPPNAIVLDAFDPHRLGGTGRTVDWPMIAAARDAGRLQNWPPLVLAGGLTPDNVADAVSIVRPLAVDVSSGVESAPGRKSAAKMEAFVRAARG